MPKTPTLTVAIDKSGTEAVKHDHQNKHAELIKGDSLQLTVGAGWDGVANFKGFTAVKFWRFDTHTTADPFFTWTPTPSSRTIEVKEGTTVKFKATAEFDASNKCTSITLEDDETLTGSGTKDKMYYAAQIGGIDMDPEIVNKSGTSGGGTAAASAWAANDVSG